jgi:hypothetical protein
MCSSVLRARTTVPDSFNLVNPTISSDFVESLVDGFKEHENFCAHQILFLGACDETQTKLDNGTYLELVLEVNSMLHSLKDYGKIVELRSADWPQEKKTRYFLPANPQISANRTVASGK